MPQASNVQMPLSSQGLDRAGHLRRDAAWLEEAFRSDRARVLIMREGLPLVEGATPPRGSAAPGTRFSGHRPLLWLGPQASLLSRSPTRLFLGLSPKGSPVFALELEADFSLSASPVAGLGVFEDFRAPAAGLDSFEAGCAATARAVFEWHRRHGFCSACGARSRIEDAGWKRRCESCGAACCLANPAPTGPGGGPHRAQEPRRHRRPQPPAGPRLPLQGRQARRLFADARGRTDFRGQQPARPSALLWRTPSHQVRSMSAKGEQSKDNRRAFLRLV